SRARAWPAAHVRCRRPGRRRSGAAQWLLGLLQLRIREKLHRLHLRVGRLGLDLVDSRAQLHRYGLALCVEGVGVAAVDAFAVRHTVDVPHLDAVRTAARGAHGPGNEALGGDTGYFVVHAAASATSPRWRSRASMD